MCPHNISTARVEAWWKREEGRKRDVWVCECCGGPCPPESAQCRFCEVGQ